MKKNLLPLSLAFVASGIWDTVAGVLYLFVIGMDRAIDNPPTHAFYSIFLASFFFCFAFLQFAASRNIRRYAVVVGCLIVGRLYYVIQLYGFMLFVPGFPDTFWFTGIVDATLTAMYILFARRAGLTLRDLFVPRPRSNA